MHFTRGCLEPYLYLTLTYAILLPRRRKKKQRKRAAESEAASGRFMEARRRRGPVCPRIATARDFQEARCGRGLACTANIDYLLVLLIGGRWMVPGERATERRVSELSTLAYVRLSGVQFAN